MELKESQHIELKESISDIDAIIVSVVAFANNGGGRIYIGIRNDGSVRGVSIGKNTIENLATTITRSIEAPVLPKIMTELLDGRNVIILEVEESRIKPHFYKNIAYKRVGKTNIQINIAGIKQMILEQSQTYFDTTLFAVDRTEIDKELFKLFLTAVSESNRLKINKNADLDETMEKLDAVEGGKVKLGFLLMFSKNPSKHLAHYGVKFAKISTERFTIESLEKSMFFAGPIFGIVDDLLFEIVSSLPKKARLEESRRVEEPIIPKSAIREFLVNSLVHADYRIASTISVLITPSYLEISNPGDLVGLQIADLYRKHRSVLRNPFVAKLMFLSGNIEQWGSGIENATQELVRAGCGLPHFQVKQGFFSVRINFAKEASETCDMITKLLSGGRKTARQLAVETKMPGRTIRNELKKLIERSIIRRERKGRTIFYKI